MAGRLAVVAALSPLALAFSDTLPVVAWSSRRSNVLDLLPSTLSAATQPASLLETILLNQDVCSHDVIVVVDQPGLHASDLRKLPPTSNLARSLSSSPSARQFPYVPSSSAVDFATIVESASARCKFELVNLGPGQSASNLEGISKHVVAISLPRLDGLSAERETAMIEYDTFLSEQLSALTSTSRNHLVIYAGSSPLSFSKRQTGHDVSDLPRPVLDLSSSLSYANTTLPTGGILKRYQLLTPGLITVLLVVFFILFPLLLVGINALASIQTTKGEVPKRFDALQKKTQ